MGKYAIRMGESSNIFKILKGNRKGKIPLGRLGAGEKYRIDRK